MSNNLPARVGDTVKNPFFVLAAGFISLAIAVISIVRHTHK